MKVTVAFAFYGCETGCTGHRVTLDDNKEERSEFCFAHWFDDGQTKEEFARELAEETFPELVGTVYELDASEVGIDV